MVYQSLLWTDAHTPEQPQQTYKLLLKMQSQPENPQPRHLQGLALVQCEFFQKQALPGGFLQFLPGLR